MKNWETKNTGKLFNLLIFSGVSFLILIAALLRSNKRHQDFIIEDFLWTILALTPILIGWIFVFSKFILGKKIPNRIIHNHESGEFVFEFQNGKKYTLRNNDFSYSYHEYSNYCVLVINKKFISSRGHTITKELMSFVGMDLKIGWKKDVVKEIAIYFDNIGIEFHKEKDRSFIFRIIE